MADIHQNLTFGAWCVRDYGFDYDDVRKHHGVAWFPVVDNDDKIEFIENKHYQKSQLIIKKTRFYKEFSIEKGKPIYQQFIENPDKFLFVSHPQNYQNLWENFIP